MKIVVGIVLLLNAMLFFAFGECMASDWNRVPDCVLKAASEGLGGFLEKIPPAEAANYRFSSAEALAKARTMPDFGAPLRLRVITPNALESYQDSMNVTELLSDTELWYVPVLEQQRIVAFLVIEQSEKFPCQAVSFGYAPIARDFQTTLNQLGADKMELVVLVVVPQAREHFIAIPDKEPYRLYSVREGKRWKEGGDESENSLSFVAKRLNSQVKANLRQDEGLQ